MRELCWRADVIKMEDWDQVAWLCLNMPSFSKRRATLKDFHPLRKQLAQVNLTKFNKWADEMKDHLPAEHVEGKELDDRWEKIKKEMIKDGG